MYIFLYFLAGLIVSWTMIKYYRGGINSRTSAKSFDLYLAALGPFIWPLQIIKFLYDIITNK